MAYPNLNVSYCKFENNQAIANGLDSNGGGIYTVTNTYVTWSTFKNNVTGDGGGAIFANLANNQTPAVQQSFNLEIQYVEFDGNSAVVGGALDSENSNNDGATNPTFIDDTFFNNTASENGGGLYFADTVGSPPKGPQGAGSNPYVVTSAGVFATLTNDTFFKNTATQGNGGGLYLLLTNNTTSATNINDFLTSLTVNNNTAQNGGGGLYATAAGNGPIQGVLTVDNSIFSGNHVTANGYNGTVDFTLSNNALLADKGFNMVGTSEAKAKLFTLGTDISTDNPGLANALAQNGASSGYPQTLALSTSSAGYEKGDQGLVQAGGYPSTDERGFDRQANKVSIGAEDPDAIAP